MALKRDSKGRYVKRGAKKKARTARNAPRKRRAGLRGHKPGCKCVIHARRRRVARNTARRRPVARAKKRSVRPVRRTAPRKRRTVPRSNKTVTLQLSKTEALSFTHGGPKIHAKVKRRAALLLHRHAKVRVVGPTGTALANIHR